MTNGNDLLEAAKIFEARAVGIATSLFNCNGVDEDEGTVHKARVAYAADCAALANFLREQFVRETAI